MCFCQARRSTRVRSLFTNRNHAPPPPPERVYSSLSRTLPSLSSRFLLIFFTHTHAPFLKKNSFLKTCRHHHPPPRARGNAHAAQVWSRTIFRTLMQISAIHHKRSSNNVLRKSRILIKFGGLSSDYRPVQKPTWLTSTLCKTINLSHACLEP